MQFSNTLLNTDEFTSASDLRRGETLDLAPIFPFCSWDTVALGPSKAHNIVANANKPLDISISPSLHIFSLALCLIIWPICHLHHFQSESVCVKKILQQIFSHRTLRQRNEHWQPCDVLLERLSDAIEFTTLSRSPVAH